MTTDNKDSDGWTSFGIGIGTSLITLIISIILGVYVIYLSKLAAAGVFANNGLKEVVILQSGDCKWTTNFGAFDKLMDKSGFMSMIYAENSNNIFEDYVKLFYKNVIEWQFFIMNLFEYLNPKEKTWEFCEIFVLLYSVVVNFIIFGALFISLFGNYFINIYWSGLKILLYDTKWSLIWKGILFLAIFFIFQWLLWIPLIIFIPYFLYLISRLNTSSSFSYLSLFANIITYKFPIILAILCLTLIVTIGSSFGWYYALVCVLITGLMAWKTELFIPKTPDNPPFNCVNEKRGGKKR